MDWLPSRSVAEAAERTAIQAEKPLYNIISTARHGELIGKALRVPGLVSEKPHLSILEIEARFGVSRQTIRGDAGGEGRQRVSRLRRPFGPEGTGHFTAVAGAVLPALFPAD